MEKQEHKQLVYADCEALAVVMIDWLVQQIRKMSLPWPEVRV